MAENRTLGLPYQLIQDNVETNDDREGAGQQDNKDEAQC